MIVRLILRPPLLAAETGLVGPGGEVGKHRAPQQESSELLHQHVQPISVSVRWHANYEGRAGACGPLA